MSSHPITYRPFAGESDYPKMLAVIEASKDIDGTERADTLADIARNYAHLHNCDPAQDMLFAEAGGQVVGYGRAWWDLEKATPADSAETSAWIGFHIGFVHPTWRRKGIGTHILRHLRSRLSEIAAAQIATGTLLPTTPCLCSAFTSQTEKAQIGLLEKEGYVAVRHAFDMVRPDLENIPDLPLPDGLNVRAPAPDEIKKVWDASNEAFRDHWGFIPEPEEERLNWMQSPEYDPTLWRVAWDGDRVAGMVLSFINQAENEAYHRKRGYTENICVLRPYRAKGLAKALIALSLRALKERGMDHAALGVDAENLSGALQLYKRMGYQVIKQSTIYRKPVEAAGYPR
ncbi:MAG: GNAT family N-acetyltransferase [Chloroflexota bacterium]